MDPFEYFGIDWLGFLLVVVHLVLVAHQIRKGWLFGIGAAATYIVFGIMTNSLATIIMNITLIMIHGFAYFKTRAWDKVDPEPGVMPLIHPEESTQQQ